MKELTPVELPEGVHFADAREVVFKALAEGLRPIKKIPVSDWADANRMLSARSSAERGRWRTERTPYLREVMDALSARSPYERIVFMKGTQIGATEAGSNWVGYTIDVDPGPMLMVLPTVDIARRVSKQRLTPMLQECPALMAKVAPSRSRDSGNTTFSKEFTGGILILTGANSAAGLRSMPIKKLFMDEVDSYPGDVGDEGDPVRLAEARTETFARRRIFMVSTPTVRGLSRIEKAYLATDQRRYVVPCPECGTFDWIQWSMGGWSGKEGKHHHIVFENRDPQTARLCCSACDAHIEERHKTEMLAQGHWEPTAESNDPRTVGFHLSALYSPAGWKSWADCVGQFLEAKEDAFQLKTWVNTVLGETWEEAGTAIDADSLLARIENYTADVPTGVGVLVAAVDVQDDRLEAFVWGFGAGEESWLIAHEQLFGDPGHDPLWFDLDRFLKASFSHESGQQMRIECTVVDSGGHHTDQVYRFCKARQGRRVFAIRGGSAPSAEVVSKPSQANRYRVLLFTLGVDTAKDMFYSRLRIKSRGPGFVHLPAWTDGELVAQLTAEKAIRKYVRGRGAVRQWVKTRERNEALDGAVYALAGLRILGNTFAAHLAARAARFATASTAPAATMAPEMAPPPATAPREGPGAAARRRSGWVNRWRG